MRADRGFTIIELLVAMAVLSIVLLAFTSLFGGMFRASSDLNARNQLLSEGQLTEQILAARIQQAFYVYPPGYKLQLTSSGWTTKNPAGGRVWVVGSDPILAMILPPKSSTVICGVGTDPNAGCYRFYAYYPVKRSLYVNNAAAAGNPGKQALNDNSTWILMQYYKPFPAGRQPLKPYLLVGGQTIEVADSSDTAYRGTSSHFMVDYVQPTSASPSYTMFSYKQGGDPTGTVPGKRVTEGIVDLRFLLHQSGRTYHLPQASSDSTTISIRPWNVFVTP